MAFKTQLEVENMIYSSYLRAINNISETLDENVRKPELTRRLLDLIGKPDAGQKYILVTGSKGKGSTSRFISSLLSHLGYKVGLFTSPHLVDFNERIRIDGDAISEDDFIRIGNKVKPCFERIEQHLPQDEYQGPVGIAFAMASLYFNEQQTDINVIECGRGGTYDDTNVIHNDWAVITPIMEEHVNHLGADIERITHHKLGIVKHNTTHVYVNKQRKHVLAYIKAALASTPTTYYDDHFSASDVDMTTRGTTFTIKTRRTTYHELTMPLLGEFQAINMSLAIQCCEDIIDHHIDETIVKQCLTRMQWPGRCEIVHHEPLTIVDGAIHKDSALYVTRIVKLLQLTTSQGITAIISVPKDKDYAGVIEVMSTVAHTIIVTRPDISHLMFPDDALIVAEQYCANSYEFPLLEEALQFAKTHYPSQMLVIVGTQQFIGNAKRLFGQSLLHIGH